MAQRICVTGASGLAGRAVVRDLLEHGYDVSPTDIAATRTDMENGMVRADLTDYGQAAEALSGWIRIAPVRPAAWAGHRCSELGLPRYTATER